MRSRSLLFRLVVVVAAVACTAAAPGDAHAQRAFARDSLGSVVALVNAGRSAEEIIERVSIDCYTFEFEGLETALRRRPGYEGLADRLKFRCSRVLVHTDPPNANLFVNGRDLGTVSEVGDMWWIDPGERIEVEVSIGMHSARRTIDAPRGRMVEMRFFLPRDTLPWPTIRTPVQVAEDLGLYSRWTPSTPRPQPPIRPEGMAPAVKGLLWGIVGGGAGYAAGQLVPSLGCVSKQTVPAGEQWHVRGQTYSGGSTVDLGHGMPCLAATAGTVGGGMFIFSTALASGGRRAANARYADAERRYPGELLEWETREKAAFAQRSPEVREAISSDQIRLAQAQSDNRNISIRNRSLPQPEVRTRELVVAARRQTTQVATENIATDLALNIPRAVMPNPHAVAIVIGNRDYHGERVPKVEYAVRDAKMVARYLVEAFGFSPDRVILDTNVTAGRFPELFGTPNDPSIGRLANLIRARPRDSVDVFVFYSGHGAPDGDPPKGFLVPVDANLDRLRATGYPIDVLYQNLAALDARSVTVALDACFSGSSERGTLFHGRSATVSLDVELTTVASQNAQVFTAATSRQTARWRQDQGHGLFTYFFLKGLQGEADLDRDGQITAGELDEYVKRNVYQFALERLDGAVQTPEVVTNNPSRVVLTLGPRGTQ